MSESEQVPITTIQQMISSCSGALITSLFVTPLDVIKIRLQAQQRPFHKGTPFMYSNGLMDHLCICSHCESNGTNGNTSVQSGVKSMTSSNVLKHVKHTIEQRPWYYTPEGHFKGTLDAMIKISRTEGIPALWSGLSPTLVMAVPATVVYYTTYDKLKYAWGYNEKDPSTQYVPVLAGCAARTFATTLISPLELIRTKMQSEQLSYKELGKAVRITMSDCGAIILMRGLGPTLLRDVPFSGILWFGYEKMKAYQMKKEGNIEGPPTFHQCVIASSVSGTIAAVATVPFDVIKTHRQIELGKAEFCRDTKVTSTWSLMKNLHSEKGIRGLFAGITPRIAKITPACAIMISSYEYGKAFFRNLNEQKRLENT